MVHTLCLIIDLIQIDISGITGQAGEITIHIQVKEVIDLGKTRKK